MVTTTAIQKGNHKAGEVQGQTRQHARLAQLVGRQAIDCWRQQDGLRHGWLQEEKVQRNSQRNAQHVEKVGWKKDFVEKSVPVLPISGWMGDNLLKKTTNMGWWSGVDVEDYIRRQEVPHRLLVGRVEQHGRQTGT